MITKFFDEFIPKKLLIKGRNVNTREEIRISVSLEYRFDWDKIHLRLSAPIDKENERRNELRKAFGSHGLYVNSEDEDFRAC